MGTLKWYAPANQQEITDIALHYVFEAEPGAKAYTIFASKNPDFSEARTIQVPQKEGCEDAYYLPEDDELLEAGEWYIKAVSDRGTETDVIRILVNDVHSKAPLRTQITREHPFFTIFDHSIHRTGAEYDVLPEDLKEYAAIMGGAGWSSGPEELLEKNMAFDALGYPWVTHFFSHAEVINGKYVIVPLPVAEQILASAKNLKAVVGLEIYMGVRAEDDWVNRIYQRVVMLCGKYGIPFLHTDGNRNDIDLAAVIRRPVFTDVLREYSDYVVFSYKQNHANASYSCYGAILGAWMDGIAGNIGIQAENWYWNDAGFCDDIGGYYGYLQGNEQQIPAVFSAQMLLPGLSLGACYYSMEGEGWLIQMRGTDEYEYSPQGIAMLSLLRMIIQHHLIPAKEEVLGQIRAVIDADGCGKDWGDAWEGGIFRKTFQNLYGILHTKELFPKQLRYFYLPFASERKDAFSGYHLVNIKEIGEPEDANRILNAWYPKWFDGDAYLTRSGKNVVLMNSRENTDQAQWYDLKLKDAVSDFPLIERISGTVELWQYAVLSHENGIVLIHANARKGSVFEMQLKPKAGVTLKLTSRTEGAVLRYDEAAECCVFSFTGSDQPVECVISASESMGEDAKALLLEPLANRPFDEIYLSDQKPVWIQGTEKGVPTVNYMANLMYGKLPISINAIRYPHGISMPRKSAIVYRLDGAYSRLTMTVGFDIDVWMPIIVNHTDIVWDRYEKEISIVLKIYGDDQLIYESPVLTSTHDCRVVTLDVKGIRELRFEMDGEIVQKPLWCAITGTADRYLYDTSKADNIPPAEVYLDLGNPVLEK